MEIFFCERDGTTELVDCRLLVSQCVKLGKTVPEDGSKGNEESIHQLQQCTAELTAG